MRIQYSRPGLLGEPLIVDCGYALFDGHRFVPHRKNTSLEDFRKVQARTDALWAQVVKAIPCFQEKR